MIQVLVINDKNFKPGKQTANGFEFVVTLADTPLKAFNEIIHISPDAIILNTENAEMDAFWVYNRIRNMQASKEVPVLLCCSLEQEMEVKKHTKDGHTDYFTTPVTVYESLDWAVKKLGTERPAMQKSIIVVDDDPVILDISTLYLGAKYKVIPYRSANDTLKALEQAVPDMILLDIAMPDMDGKEVFKRIRAIPGCGDVPIVFQTGMAGMKTVTECIKLGAAGFVVKPIQKQALLEKVEELLGQPVKQSNQKKIFLFEEFDFMYQLILGYCKGEYEVIRGESVTAGLNHIEEIAPDVIMIDLDNSAFMVGRCREKSVEMKVPMILMTKDTAGEAAQKEKKNSNTYFLSLPLRKEMLIDTIENIGPWKG